MHPTRYSQKIEYMGQFSCSPFFNSLLRHKPTKSENFKLPMLAQKSSEPNTTPSWWRPALGASRRISSHTAWGEDVRDSLTEVKQKKSIGDTGRRTASIVWRRSDNLDFKVSFACDKNPKKANKYANGNKAVTILYVMRIFNTNCF